MREFFIELDVLFILKSSISDIDIHKYTNIKINWDDDLLLEKTLNMHNAVILVKSDFNKNDNHYYYQPFLEKFSNNLTEHVPSCRFCW